MPKKQAKVTKELKQSINALAKAVGTPKVYRTTKKNTRKKAVKKKAYRVYTTRGAAETAKDKQAGLNRIVKVSGGFHVLRVGKSKPKKKRAK